jgi:hypothetical protein
MQRRADSVLGHGIADGDPGGQTGEPRQWQLGAQPLHQPDRATGTGPTSGATYAIHDIITQNFESPSPPAPQFTASVHESFKVTSSDPALTFRFKVLIHAVLSPGSGFKLTKAVEEATCQG